MSDFFKTVTAIFDTIDFAELAARNLKRDFPGVKAITIKYKNYPKTPPYYHDNSYAGESSDRAGLSALGIGFYPGLRVPDDTDLFSGRREDDIPEIEQSNESKLIARVSERDAHRVEAHLRSVGGRQISVS